MVSLLTNFSKGQQLQTLLSVDSRIGYSTNTYLNPFFSEWDQSVESGYGLATVMSQSFWHKDGNSISLTGGLVYEPFFDETQTWRGGLGVFNYTRRFSGKFNGGIEAGVSHFASSFNRTTAWIQPNISWFISPFTQLSFRAGSSFRKFENFADSLDSNERFDLYALEFETWPGYRWQINTGLYGDLDTLPSLQKGFTFRATGGYYFWNGAVIRVRAGLEQYQFETTTSGGPGGPPGGFPPVGSPATEVNTDRILRFGIEGTYPINKKLSIFASAEALQFDSDQLDATTDVQVSGGIRLSVQPGLKKSRPGVEPEWENDGRTYTTEITYSGEGRLYLVGSFNDWRKPGIPLRERSKNRFVTTLNLDTGMYEYKILRIRGDSEEWVPFSEDTYTVDDSFGGKNAILLVE